MCLKEKSNSKHGETPYEASMKQTFKYKKKEKQRRKENHERLELQIKETKISTNVRASDNCAKETNLACKN